MQTLEPIKLGPVTIDRPLVLAPMAGITDKPFRRICRAHGAGYAVSEMLTSDPRLWSSRKSQLRRDHAGEAGPIGVQLAGSDPGTLADAARLNVDAGAQIIDINMGCPAKKVCKRWAGSALLQDEALVARILSAVVGAVDVPVTLKMRIGWRHDQINGPQIARIAEDAGIRMLAVHGRTRDMLYNGNASYDTIAEIKAAVGMPVLANGDIDSPAKARRVLEHTRADGLLIGRAAQGRPWIFAQIAHYLATGETCAEPAVGPIRDVMIEHVRALHEHYGPLAGVRIARKHIAWYAAALTNAAACKAAVYAAEDPESQLAIAVDYFDRELTAASTTSIQWSTGTRVAAARCS
jgi:tRNA-dihydrouridine synthase B